MEREMEIGNLIFGNSRGEFPVDRSWRNMFCQHLHDMGFDNYGNVVEARLEKYKGIVESAINEPGRKFENDVFRIIPYYWGEDEFIAELPNFWYKPTNFEINWYKYALRDSYMNQDISYDALEEIMLRCKESI